MREKKRRKTDKTSCMYKGKFWHKKKVSENPIMKINIETPLPIKLMRKNPLFFLLKCSSPKTPLNIKSLYINSQSATCLDIVCPTSKEKHYQIPCLSTSQPPCPSLYIPPDQKLSFVFNSLVVSLVELQGIILP